MSKWFSMKMLGAAFLLAVTASSVSALDPLYAGLRASNYGFGKPDKAWLGTAVKAMASRWGATPSVVWIASTYTAAVNEEYLTYFDANGIAVILQVEPFDKSVTSLIDEYLGKYKTHKSVIGFGVDIEWYTTTNGDMGKKVSDADARQWKAKIKGHNPDYILMLKHFFPSWTPPTERDGILFLDDSQQFKNFDRFINETDPNSPWNIGYRVWAKACNPAMSGMQYGYDDANGGVSDKIWWSKLTDPQKEIGDSLLLAGPNTKFLYWVDFTAKEFTWKVWSPPGKHPGVIPTAARAVHEARSRMQVSVQDNTLNIEHPVFQNSRKTEVHLMALNGKLLLSKSFSRVSKIEMKVEPSMSKGQYLLKVVSDKQTLTGRF